MAVNATGADAVRVLPTAFVYHFTLPHTIEFLPEVSESLGIKVEIKDTGRNALEMFGDYISGKLKYEHIDDPAQRRMNDWLTAWIVLSTSWPYIPILGIYRGFKLGADFVKSGDESQRWMAGILSLLLTAPFNVLMGLYEAANFQSARIREKGIDKAFMKALDEIPEVLGAGFDKSEKEYKPDAFIDGATKAVTNVMMAPFLPLMGTYRVTALISDLTHRDRLTQFIAMLIGAPILATITLPYFALLQSGDVARTVVEKSGIAGWIAKSLSSASDAVKSK
ncbi:MAG: hypothetical protein RMI34_11085 [Chloroherpetonaceae bacterium]|nr:hypothetical protein [Chloroherpetonaceae bacterium]MDW8020605.1 hypothetical protein [Chloroherpetonaceae bacterium]